MKNKKRMGWFLLGLLLVMVLLFFVGNREKTKTVQIGVSLYLENDTFIDKILKAMEEEAAVYEEETGVNIVLHVSVAGGSQRTQNEQVKRYVQLGYDAVCVNVVDRTSASGIIDQAVSGEKNIPVVFFNREPVVEDIMRRELVYYVGSDAKQSAILQGEMVAECFSRFPERMDKNGDGVLQYVMLEGEMGHQDTIMRSDYSLQTLGEKGVTLQKLASGTADWNKNRAALLAEQWGITYGDEIELVLCNNDDMALGAAESLEKAEIPAAIFGIDATAVGMTALEKGKLWGTVDCNGEEQGRATLRLAADLVVKGEVETGFLTDERYYRAPLISYISEALEKQA